MPIYDPNKQLQGVLAIYVSLSEISTFLSKLRFSPKGQIFIMERDGNLVATSTSDSQKLPENPSSLTLYFSVPYTGVGIAPEELPKIFEAFNQAEAGREVQEGTGLGLTISRQFVRRMGGGKKYTLT